ncbi:DNA-binding transcriptional regulator YhcF, GntR family [Fodinibius roseus]|uniref:DNA-binding transcriptional regulator YhcF, GntR family n=1 Tax=Fodinibius roseus TaxID=1194090 RepID=A0A1M5AKB4_9BACT|nr:GntR family transcriptional regulator [Fodinibius roseus]SHF30740.1 DNA-binding transcriptional regulator YhcF, GntR family [Fodinibius roseus]
MKTSAKYIADRIRLMIATKQFQVGETLPSTRQLGQQLESSFHTVRKAYHILADEGLIRGERGKGFIVERQNTNLDKADRLEIGAEKMRKLLEELIGYGLDESELDELFQEQLSFMDWPDRIESCASIGETDELGKMIADAIQREVGVRSRVLNANQYNKTVNYDALFVPVQLVNKFREYAEKGRLLPIVYSINPDTLLSIVDRAAIETIGLVTAEDQTIPKIINELKVSIQFGGSFVAGATYGKSLPLFVREADLILYTAQSAKLVEQKIPDRRRIKLEYQISPKSADTIRAELWDQ